MKKNIVFLLMLVMSGCLFPSARSMRVIVNNFDDYSVKITKIGGADGLGKIMPETSSLYVEYDADSCLVAEFSKTGVSMSVEMVSFIRSKGAMGAFLSTDLPGSTPVDIGFIGRKSDTAVEFLKGRHIVLIKPKNRRNISVALELAQHLDKKIPGDTIKPDIYEILPKTQQVDGSQLYFSGQKGFSLGFSPDLGETLRVGGAVEGAAAEYTVDDARIIFIMVKYMGRRRTITALNSYLNSRKDRPIIRPGEKLDYYTVIEPDRSESYIAENGDWLYLLMNGPDSGRAQPFFAYVLRGGR